jgi:uncharacterized cysteine cluster protein YcgN (CxxCxxCC family)
MPMSEAISPFWVTKTLDQMTIEEWESLCDSCGRCCLFKLEDEDTAEIFYTRVICRFFDMETCHCSVYSDRTRLVPTCLKLDPERAATLKWIPRSCAYRRLAEGKGLARWHPLVAKNPRSIHKSGISVKNKAISEDDVDMDNLEDYVVGWFG